MTDELKLPINMYDPTREYKEHQQDIDKAIQEVLNHGRFINGPEVKELEANLAKYIGVSHCICVGNGTDALQIALMALDIQPDDEVITVAHTWISSSEVISLLKAKPVFVDIEDITFNIDPLKIEEKITSKTKAILVVNLYGQLPDYNKIREIANKHNLKVIEDAAQSFGSVQNSRKSCSFGDIGTPSFFPTKPLGCYGDGGACFTDDDELGLKIRAIKNHGGTKRFHHDYIGINSRLDSIQAGILLEKFKYFERSLENRNNVANLYTSLLKPLEEQGKIILPKTIRGNYHAWAQYSILVNTNHERDELVSELKDHGINPSIFYPKPLHVQPCFGDLGFKDGDLPITERICKTVINVPCYAEFTKNEIEYVCQIMTAFYKIV